MSITVIVFGSVSSHSVEILRVAKGSCGLNTRRDIERLVRIGVRRRTDQTDRKPKSFTVKELQERQKLRHCQCGMCPRCLDAKKWEDGFECRHGAAAKAYYTQLRVKFSSVLSGAEEMAELYGVPDND